LYEAYYGCDQSEAQRSLAAKNTGDLKKMIIAASLLRFPITLLHCTAGLVIGALVLNTPSLHAQIPGDSPDWMIPVFIVNYLPNGIIGLLLVTIFAAAMSSVSSAINSLSAVSVEDYVRLSGKPLSEKQYLNLARWAGLFWGTVTLCLSFFAGDIAPTVIEAINKVGSVFYGPILGCFVIGIWIKRIRAPQMNIGLIFGVIGNVCLALFADNVFWFWWNLSGFVLTLSVAWISALVQKGSVSANTTETQHQPSILSAWDISVLVGWFVLILTVCVLLNASLSG
jgi:Na+/proline symporter